MSRWQEGAAERLELAARELFAEQGFADTTVPQITARAGLTTRTFFRHFADKREVLFGFDEQLPGIVAEVIEHAPADLSPMDLIAEGLQTIATTQLLGAHDYLRGHRDIVNSDQGLRERELRKQAVLLDAIHHSLLVRGLDDPSATVGAHLAMTVFTVAVDRWVDQDDAGLLPQILREVHATVRTLVNG